MSAPHSTRGAAVLLERMNVDDWERFQAGDITAGQLRRKYLREGER
ncbi:hypothetical protein NDI54_20995 [Haloarcula sp. S1AR25-5A]|uniref:Uncharacterized protein n=1 Tax=Haloarcula terrestris TaxID=2950533 RepID=A0AAE4F2L8_9EURY|nr:hypothetical protein [Haloarcula terrestris]MDS0223809.1 hypothetical protein [Haloarcula terrestris]